jgi:phage terminase large subunit-like protein
MGIRVNPLTVMITTASEKLESPFRDTLKLYKKILRGEMENDSVFAHIFEPDVDDEEDNPETWKKVQPHLGITVQDDYYELEYKKAQQSADDMVTFRTKLLNISCRTRLNRDATADIEAISSKSFGKSNWLAAYNGISRSIR